MKDNIMIYLCDDNRLFAEKIEKEINRILAKKRKYNIRSFQTGRGLINQWNKEFADVVFLDIDMPEMSGFEVATKLQKSKEDIIIIFVTSYEDKVYQSWVYQPFWFVRKSHIDDLEIVLPRLLTKIDAEYEKEKNIFNLRGENCVIEMDINSVTYIESFRHDIIINYKNKKQSQLRCKISDAEVQVSPLDIVRVQRGILVNCRYISRVTSREVILTDGKKIHINRERIDYVKDRFQHFVRSRCVC